MNKIFQTNSVWKLRDLLEDIEVAIRVLASAEINSNQYMMAMMAEEEEGFILRVAEKDEEGATYVLLSENGQIAAYAAEPENEKEWNRVAEHLEKESEYIIYQAEETAE